MESSTSRWLIAAYRPVTLFSLRMTHATSKGGKTLVVPTPYSIKMALLDACFRRYSSADALAWAHRVMGWLVRRAVRVPRPRGQTCPGIDLYRRLAGGAAKASRTASGQRRQASRDRPEGRTTSIFNLGGFFPGELFRATPASRENTRGQFARYLAFEKILRRSQTL